jgi:lipopolysaccharide export system permease protein
MRILDRYLFREVLVSVFYNAAGFLVLVVIFDLFGRLGRFTTTEVTLREVGRFYLHFLLAMNGVTSFAVAMLLIALLLGTLYTCTRLSRQNEIVAMMACGLRPARFFLPFLAVGVAGVVTSLALQEYAAPASYRSLKQLEHRLFGRGEERPEARRLYYFSAAGRRLWDIHSFSPTNTARLGFVVITEYHPDGTLTEYRTSLAQYLDGTWWLRAPTRVRKNRDGALIGQPEQVDRQDIEMPEWKERPRDFLIEYLVQTYDSEEALSGRDLADHLRNRPDLSEAKRARLRTDLHARLAIPFSALLAVLLGIPVGVRSSRLSVMPRILAAIGAFFLFFLILQASLFLGKRLWLPPVLAAWLPNLVFLTAAIGFNRSLTE